MNNWLKLQIANRNGIAANIHFLSPNEIIQRLYFMLGGRFPDMLSAQNLRWLLYTVLGETQFLRRFPSVSSYYDKNELDSDLKKMALAEKTADLFDQYQIYRPEWIISWNQEQTDESDAGNWQRYLWSRAKLLSQERLPDKTIIGKFIREALKDPGNRQMLLSKMPVLHLFGLSIITDYHLEILTELSSSVEISFHLVNPAPAVYWFEDRSERQLAFLKKNNLVDKSEVNTGNELLGSWGRVIQDTFLMLFRNEDLLNRLEEVGTEEPATDSLLHKIQHDIYHGASGSEKNAVTLGDARDGSITINSCFTIAREVEVLYNYLVHLVDIKKQALSPRDIVVMVTDIDAYAPYIKAVFRNAPYNFHFTVADETYSIGDTLISALTAILELNTFNFNAENVLRLLDSGLIRQRFNIRDTELVRQIVGEASIRFGMKGSEADDTRFVSWEYGLKRIMYGICMSGSAAYTDPDGELLYPMDNVEGSLFAQVVRFVHFVQVLMDAIAGRERPRQIAEWVEYTERLVHSLIFEPEEEPGDEYILLQEQLKNMNIASEFMSEQIGYDIFVHSLSGSVSGERRTGTFAGGGITFCSLIPMRSIPFSVVAVLGLNFDKFPRKETKGSFNLMEKDRRRRGDRNVKENDKHLFLDTVLSARDWLYLSYLGQSAKDNTPIPPSTLVDELVDYITSGADEPEKVRSAIITRHPLHNFSRGYLTEKSRYYNYLDQQRPEMISKRANEVRATGTRFDEITLKEFVSFFKNPVKAYYNKVLDIYYGKDAVLLADTEIFELNYLQDWKLKPQLLAMEPGEKEQWKQKLVRTGELPLKNMAAVVVDKIDHELSLARQILEEYTAGHIEKKIDVQLTIDGSLLTATLDKIYDDKMLFISFSAAEQKYLLEAYLRYLVASAAGLDVTIHFISAKKQKVFVGNRISKAEAGQRLEQLVKLFRKGHQSIMAFTPEINVKPDELDAFDEVKLEKLMDKMFTEYEDINPDEYLSKEFSNGFFQTSSFLGDFKANAAWLIEPLGNLFPDFYDKKKK